MGLFSKSTKPGLPDKKSSIFRKPTKVRRRNLFLKLLFAAALLALIAVGAHYFHKHADEPDKTQETQENTRSGYAPPTDLRFAKQQETVQEPPQSVSSAPSRVIPRAQVAIIIDDVGLHKRLGQAFIELPAPLNLSFLPYAPNVRSMAQNAADHGHSVMVHIPMEPLDPNVDPGPAALFTKMPTSEIRKRLEINLAPFEGLAVAANNHMGSRLTQDRRTLGFVMAALKSREMGFVDSLTTSGSVADQEAEKQGLPFARRDVFLDHFEDRAAIDRALQKLERLARRTGQAIAIGHPKQPTYEALKAWIPQARAAGISLVPVETLMQPVPRLAKASVSEYSRP